MMCQATGLENAAPCTPNDIEKATHEVTLVPGRWGCGPVTDSRCNTIPSAPSIVVVPLNLVVRALGFSRASGTDWL